MAKIPGRTAWKVLSSDGKYVTTIVRFSTDTEEDVLRYLTVHEKYFPTIKVVNLGPAYSYMDEIRVLRDRITDSIDIMKIRMRFGLGEEMDAASRLLQTLQRASEDLFDLEQAMKKD